MALMDYHDAMGPSARLAPLRVAALRAPRLTATGMAVTPTNVVPLAPGSHVVSVVAWCEARPRTGSVRDAPDTFRETFHAEVDHETKPLVGQLQIGQKLPIENFRLFIGRLELNNKAIIDQQIDSECLVDRLALENDRDRFLFVDLMTEFTQKPDKHFLVGLFQQARAIKAMYSKRTFDDVGGNLVKIRIHIRILADLTTPSPA